MVKQSEITPLNRDNERLATELRDTLRQAPQRAPLATQLELARKTTETTLTKIES